MKSEKTLAELERDYDLEFPRIFKEIKKQKARRVLIQLPDGLKPLATEISDELEKETEAKIFIWLGSCFGACDVPNAERNDFDLIVQFGHSAWKRQ